MTAPRTLGLITARAGSKGLPNKHLQDLGGRSVMAWTVAAALGATHLDRVVVSTDGEPIAAECRRLGADVPFMRPSELAGDESSHVDVILHALDWLRDEQGYDPDVVVLLQPTSPFRDAADIDGAIALHRQRDASDVLSVSPAPVHPYHVYAMDTAGRLAPYVAGRPADRRRQDLPAAWHMDGAIFLLGVARFRAQRTCFPPASLGFAMPPGHGLQIDTAADLDEARRILDRLQS